MISDLVEQLFSTVTRAMRLDYTVITSRLVVNFTRLTYVLSLQLLEARVFVLTVNGERTVNASVNCWSDETLPTFYDYKLWYLTHGYAPSSFFLTLLCFLCLSSNYVQIAKSAVGLLFTSTYWNVVTNFLKEITETLFGCLYIVKLKQ